MSKWKYRFNGSGNTVGSEESEIFDLVDDMGLDPDDLDKMTDAEIDDIIKPMWEDWFYNYFNGGWWKVDDEEND